MKRGVDGSVSRMRRRRHTWTSIPRSVPSYSGPCSSSSRRSRVSVRMGWFTKIFSNANSLPDSVSGLSS